MQSMNAKTVVESRKEWCSKLTDTIQYGVMTTAVLIPHHLSQTVAPSDTEIQYVRARNGQDTNARTAKTKQFDPKRLLLLVCY